MYGVKGVNLGYTGMFICCLGLKASSRPICIAFSFNIDKVKIDTVNKNDLIDLGVVLFLNYGGALLRLASNEMGHTVYVN